MKPFFGFSDQAADELDDLRTRRRQDEERGESWLDELLELMENTDSTKIECDKDGHRVRVVVDFWVAEKDDAQEVEEAEEDARRLENFLYRLHRLAELTRREAEALERKGGHEQ